MRAKAQKKISGSHDGIEFRGEDEKPVQDRQSVHVMVETMLNKFKQFAPYREQFFW